MPIFTLPLAFIGLLAVPALIAIYWLRNRAREHQVSSLLLWLDERQKWEGGQRIHHLQTPLLFFLELLLILLLVMAAAGPKLRAGQSGSPLVVVLDDSFSMLAGNQESARTRALAALEGELRSHRYEPLRLVIAGETPQVLGEASSQSGDAVKWLKDWKCAAHLAKLEEAVAFALELGGSRARVLVVTDHAPPEELHDGKIEWWAFGSPRPNVAFVNATRTTRDNQERVLLELANLSTSAGSTTLMVESINASDPNQQQSVTGDQQINSQSISLAAGETRRVVFTLKAGAPPLRARLGSDALDLDNVVVLMPESNRPVRVDLRVGNKDLRALLEKALQSAQNVLMTGDKPELVIGDETDAGGEVPDAWTLRIVVEKDASSFLGPFVIDRSHPLSEGLSLSGVVWGSGKGIQFPGMPIITAGNVPLLTDVDRAGKHELRLRLRPDLSTLQETPNWPILIWNLVAWRALSAPGLRQANVRLGSDATLKVEPGVKSVTVIDPRRRTTPLPVYDNAVTVKAETIGVYDLKTNEGQYLFAANALQREESDLTGAASGRWGNWASAAELQWEYRSITWLLLLLAMIVLAVHAWLVSRARGAR